LLNLGGRQKLNLVYQPFHLKFSPEEETIMVNVNLKKLVKSEKLESG
jgi:hypothetical protein